MLSQAAFIDGCVSRDRSTCLRISMISSRFLFFICPPTTWTWARSITFLVGNQIGAFPFGAECSGLAKRSILRIESCAFLTRLGSKGVEYPASEYLILSRHQGPLRHSEAAARLLFLFCGRGSTLTCRDYWKCLRRVND